MRKLTIRITKLRFGALLIASAMLLTSTAWAAHVFSDVADGAFYAGPAEWAQSNGITTGSPAGSSTFRPDDPATRGETVTFLKRYHDNVAGPAISANATNIAINTDNIDINGTNIDANTVGVQSNADSLALNLPTIGSNTSGMLANAAAIDLNTSDIAANAAAITGNTSGVAANAAAITSNTSGVAANATAIAAIPAPSVPGLQIVHGATVTLAGSAAADAVATCPAGKRLTGGGYITTDGVPFIDVFRSWPFSSTQWKASGKNTTTTPHDFSAYAICATAP